MLKVLLCFVVAAPLAGPAVAAELPIPVPKPATAAAPNWTGVYVGVTGGFAFDQSDAGASAGDLTDGVTLDGSGGDDKSTFLGVEAGYDKQVGDFVFGIAGDVRKAD